MPSLTIDTPTGPVSVTSDGNAITRVTWVNRPCHADDHTPDALCHEAADQLQSYFSKTLTQFTVPIALSGSSLQMGVWNAMLRIPFGQVETYGDVAHELGAAAQAVGTACGQNPIPIIVPCHRIVGAGGKLVGFSGGDGIDTKAYLLDHESGQTRLF